MGTTGDQLTRSGGERIWQLHGEVAPAELQKQRSHVSFGPGEADTHGHLNERQRCMDRSPHTRHTDPNLTAAGLSLFCYEPPV